MGCHICKANSKETLHKLKAILIFYQKLIVPASILTGLIGVMGFGITEEFSFKVLGISYVILALLFHYFIYEVKHFNEYYFYYNMGLNRLTLWTANCILSLIIGLVITLL